jgi:excisionase family DNA binding protein
MSDTPITAWSPAQLAHYIGMSYDFVLAEIAAGEIKASRFGAHWRIHSSAVWEYLTGKGFPVPVWMQDGARLYAAPDTTDGTVRPDAASIPAS